MKTKKILAPLGALLVFSHYAAAGAALPDSGWYGFDWLHPENAECVKMTKKLLARFKSCEYRADGGFAGDNVETYECTVNEHVQYLVFKNKKICNDQLDVMESIGGSL